MTTDTLQDYEALIESGFSELQAKAMVRTFASPPADPEVLHRLDQIDNQFSRINDTLALILERLERMDDRFDRVEERLDKLEEDNRKIHEDLTNLSARVQILEDRIRTENRVTRMINATLIALGALAASLAAILTR